MTDFFIESSGSSFTPVPAGIHTARCYRIIDLGTQKSEFDGQLKMNRKIKICWEVHGNDDEGNPIVTSKNEPMVINKDYNFSWDDRATLRIHLQSWRGKPFTDEEQKRFNLKSVLDKWCMINVTHKAKKNGTGVYANVSAVTPVPNALKADLPAGHNAASIFMIGEPDMEMFNSFGDALKKQIGASPEWQAVKGRVFVKQNTGAGSGFDDMDDDMPF